MKKIYATLPLITLVLGIVLVAVMIFFHFQGNVSAASQSQSVQSEVKTSSQDNEGYQIATIDITSNGFGPENIEVKAGVPTKIDFKKRAK
jgi:hypothetical protein